MKQKIYDCVTFFNELDLLELRLKELDDVVDYFVIVEANKTFSGKDKPFHFLKNKGRYKKWMEKIIYVKVEDMPLPTPMIDNETLCKIINIFDKKRIYRRFKSALSIGRFRPQTYQRNKIFDGLKKCSPNDIIMVSDLDEFPDKKKFDDMRRLLKKSISVGFEQTYYAYYLNCRVMYFGKPLKGPFTKCCLYKTLGNHFNNKPQDLRIQRKFVFFGDKRYLDVIKNGGWHFTYLGGEEKVLEKLDNVSENGFDKKKAIESIKMGYFGEPDQNLRLKFLEDVSYLPESFLKDKDVLNVYIKR